MLRPIFVSLRGKKHPAECALSWIARNNMQRGPLCEEDPALPVLFTLIDNSEKFAWRIFQSYSTQVARVAQ
ncbi:MAG: hypothetical protein JWQ76_4186 [Ramlibacter sp.]|nr:hypothetical protein [Ramlibacter sp.]